MGSVVLPFSYLSPFLYGFSIYVNSFTYVCAVSQFMHSPVYFHICASGWLICQTRITPSLERQVIFYIFFFTVDFDLYCVYRSYSLGNCGFCPLFMLCMCMLLYGLSPAISFMYFHVCMLWRRYGVFLAYRHSCCHLHVSSTCAFFVAVLIGLFLYAIASMFISHSKELKNKALKILFFGLCSAAT